MSNTKELVGFDVNPKKGEIWLVKIGGNLQLIEREVVEVKNNAVQLKFDKTYSPPSWYKTSDIDFVEKLK